MVPHGFGGEGSGNSAAASSVWCARRRCCNSAASLTSRATPSAEHGQLSTACPQLLSQLPTAPFPL